MGRGLLIIVSGLFIVYGIIQNSLNDRQKNITQFSANYAEKTKAETIANAMADMAFAEINKYPQDEEAGDLPTTNIMGGSGKVESTIIQPEPRNPFLKHKIMTATGTFEGETVEIVVTAKRRAFSKYSYFTNVEGNINFTGGDILNGPVHTNGEMTVNGDATFNGPVTVVEGCDGCDRHNPDFKDKVDLSADEINLPIEVPKLGEAAKDAGMYFSDDKIKLEFRDDGTANVTKYRQSGTSEKCVDYRYSRFYGYYCAERKTVPTYETTGGSVYNLNDPNFNGIISTTGNVEVEGTLDGDVTMHSTKDIRIMGDVRYKDAPTEDDASSDDFLGMISEGHTIVDRDAHSANGTKNLDIHASIMALKEVDDDTYKGSFYVEGYDSGSKKGYLNLLGGLIQYKRGAVGTGGGWGGGTGYLKNYTYDERFLGRAPRGFPPSDIYDFVSWKVKYPEKKSPQEKS